MVFDFQLMIIVIRRTQKSVQFDVNGNNKRIDSYAHNPTQTLSMENGNSEKECAKKR